MSISKGSTFYCSNCNDHLFTLNEDIKPGMHLAAAYFFGGQEHKVHDRMSCKKCGAPYFNFNTWHCKIYPPLFHKGEKAICLEHIEGFVTKDKTYEVIDLRPEEKRVVIIDDRGREGWYNESRFR